MVVRRFTKFQPETDSVPENRLAILIVCRFLAQALPIALKSRKSTRKFLISYSSAQQHEGVGLALARKSSERCIARKRG